MTQENKDRVVPGPKQERHGYYDSIGRASLPQGKFRESGEGGKVEVVTSRGVTFASVAPHEMRLRWPDGEEFVVPPSGVVVNAAPVEENAGLHPSGATLVRTRFVVSEAEEAKLAAVEAKHPGAVVLGSIIAAQAFPGRVLALVPVPGFERVPPAEKRMRADRFTTF